MNNHQKKIYAEFLKRQKLIDVTKKTNKIIINPESISENIRDVLTLISQNKHFKPDRKAFLKQAQIEILKKWSKRRKYLRDYNMKMVEHKHLVYNNPIADKQNKSHDDGGDIEDYMLFDDTERYRNDNRKRIKSGYDTNKKHRNWRKPYHKVI
jgi:hypothetical protein